MESLSWMTSRSSSSSQNERWKPSEYISVRTIWKHETTDAPLKTSCHQVPMWMILKMYETAPVGQGFWSLVPQLFSAWTWCLTKVLPPRLSYSWNTFLDTPLSHTVACNTEGLHLTGCFISTPADRRRLILAFSCQIFHGFCLCWVYHERQVENRNIFCFVFKYSDLFSLINNLAVMNYTDEGNLTVCEVLGLAVKCRGKDQRCCSVSGSEGKSGMTYTNAWWEF